MLIEQDMVMGDVLNVEWHGTLSDGSKYNGKVDDLVGHVAGEELAPARDRSWWVKSKLDNESYLVSSGEGFNVWNCIVKPKRQ